MSETAKSSTIDKAPKRINLLGERSRPESAQHIISFPGGAIELTRIADDEYWCHIIINRRQFTGSDSGGLTSARGEVIDSRIGREGATEHLGEIERHESVEQIAVLVKARKP